jgi:hypothetical protein
MLARLRGRGAPETAVGRFEAVTDSGTRALAARTVQGRDLSASFADHAIELTLERPEWVEFRVTWTGRGELEVDYFYGMFADEHDPRWVFRNTEFGFGYGPFRRYPPGDYVVQFRTQVDHTAETPMVRLSVMTAHQRTVLASRVIRGADLEAPGVQTEIALPIRLDSARVLEFPIEFLAPGVSVDQIRVVPRR